MNYSVLSIIDPAEVRTLAFSDVAGVPEEMLSEENIKFAISRFVAPVVGHSLLEAISLGEYEEIKSPYLQSSIAFYVRYISAYDSTSEVMHILERARHYLKQLSATLESNSSSYPEYNGAENILNRCRINGGLVQIL